MHEGHRQRMYERLSRADGLQDHELLEILLFSAVPRKNTNPIAHELLSAFSTLEGVFRADMEELLSVRGVGKETAAYLKCVGAVYARMNRKGEELPRFFNVRTFSEYVSARLGALGSEAVELYCIDANERVRCSRRFAVGTADRAELEPEEVSRFLALQHPAGLVAAHNHPSAPARPSDADDAFTAQLQLLCSMNNVRFYDHIIVGTDGTYSYFLVGRMEEIRRNFDVAHLIGGKLCP